jgi:Lar family restriction alleviation protein
MTEIPGPYGTDPIVVTTDSHDDAAAGLLPCPFCGDTDVTVLESDACWFGYCNGCLARGPREIDREHAGEIWNARAVLGGER